MGNTHTGSSIAHCFRLSFSSINEELRHQSEEQVLEAIKANKNLDEIIVDDSVSEHIWDAVISNPRIETVEFEKVDVEARAVVRVLRDMKNIKSIRFTGDRYSVLNMDDKVFFLGHVQINNTLEHIDLYQVSFGNTFVKALAQSAPSSLMHLQIYNSNVENDGFSALVEALPRFRVLQKLDFHDDELVIDDASANAFSQVARNMTETVKIQLKVPEAGAYEMLGVLVSNTALSYVSLKCLRPGGARFQESIANFRSDDRDLSLYGGHGGVQVIAEDSIKEIALEIVAQIAGGVRKTQDLTLSNCRFGPHEIQILCDGLVDSGTVEYLDLRFNQVGEQGLLSLGNMLPRYPTLSKLVLSNAEISDDMICSFCDALAPVDTLKEVGLSGNNIRDRGAAALAECIANKKLSPQSLTLALNNIGDIGVVALAKCMENDELSLRTLNLGYNRFGDTGATAIANALARPSSPLEVLKLAGIKNVGDEVYESLGNALKINRNLKELSMNHFRSAAVTAEGVRAFLDGVKVHPSLQEVHLMQSSFNLLQLDELHYYLELNKGARDLLQCQPPLPQTLWPRVFKKADNCRNDGERRRAPDVLYYFVKERCDLFARSIPVVKQEQSTLSGRKRPAPSEDQEGG